MSVANACENLQKVDEMNVHIICSAALHLRSVTQTMPKSKTPIPTSIETLKSCSPDLPEEILAVYKTLMCGLWEPTGDHNKEAVQRKVIGMTTDAVYDKSRGTVHPWKHTLIGLGLGTLTGSKLVLQMLNRLGHSLNYNEIVIRDRIFTFNGSK